MASEIKGSPDLHGESAANFNKKADDMLEFFTNTPNLDFEKIQMCRKILKKSTIYDANDNSWLSDKWEGLPIIEEYVDYYCYLPVTIIDNDTEMLTAFVYQFVNNMEIEIAYFGHASYDPKIGSEDLVNQLFNHFNIN